MKFKQNLLKNINSIAVGFGLISFAAFTDVAKAEEILLAESKMVQSGERFLLFSGDILYLVP